MCMCTTVKDGKQAEEWIVWSHGRWIGWAIERLGFAVLREQPPHQHFSPDKLSVWIKKETKKRKLADKKHKRNSEEQAAMKECYKLVRISTFWGPRKVSFYGTNHLTAYTHIPTDISYLCTGKEKIVSMYAWLWVARTRAIICQFDFMPEQTRKCKLYGELTSIGM